MAAEYAVSRTDSDPGVHGADEGLPARDAAAHDRRAPCPRHHRRSEVEAVRESGVQDGIACVYSPHTTCCVRVNEFEQGFLEDFAQMLLRLVPRETLLRAR